MDRAFLEKQRNLALKHLEEIKDGNESEKRAVAVIYEYLSSLLQPEKHTEAQRENFRKLALELGYKETTSFSEWTPTTLATERNK